MGDTVFKRAFVLMILLIAAQCIASAPLAAQVVSPCLVTQRWDFPVQIPFGWSFFSSYPGTYAYLISAASSACAPPAAAAEFCPKCQNAGKPISLTTGNTFIEETDIKNPGLGGGLNLKRTWISAWPPSQNTFQIGAFGPNWRSTYEERVLFGVDGYFRYSRSDGSFWSYGVSSGGWTLAGGGGSVGLGGTMSVGGDGLGVPTPSGKYWTIAFQNGETRLFDPATGRLVSIVDRNANTTQVAYDSYGRLATVTDAAARHLYFNYGSTSSSLVTSVTSDFGISIGYSYDTSSRLTQVTEQDGSTFNFTYNSASLITSVTDSMGKVLESHTYDSKKRGLTSSRASGVEALSITY
jgi:YD repeat-containing protein